MTIIPTGGPTPANPNAAPAAPDTSTLPVISNTPPEAPAANPAPPANTPQSLLSKAVSNPVVHDVLRGVKHMGHAIEGKEAVYTPNEDGTYSETLVPRKPGGFFRDLLKGTMYSLAAEANTPKAASPAAALLQGFGVGGTAAIAGQRADDARARTIAQNRAAQMKVQSDTNKARSDADQAEVAAAVSHMVSLNLAHFAHDLAPNQMQSLNNANDVLYKVLEKDGQGTRPQIMGPNNEDLNGGNPTELMKKYNSDPDAVMSAGDDYVRLPFYHYGAGANHVPGQGHVNEDGSQANLNDGSYVQFLDIPKAQWTKTIKVPAKVIQAIRPGLLGPPKDAANPDKTFNVRLGDLFTLNTLTMKDRADARAELYRAPQNENEAAAIQSERDEVNAQLARGEQVPADIQHRYAIKGPMADKFMANLQAQKNAASKPLVIDSADKANAVLADPNESKQRKQQANAFLSGKGSYETRLAQAKKQAEAATDQAIKQGDPNTAGKLLYDGTLTLSELKARSSTPKFITDATNAAKTMAAANGENDWTPQRAEAQFNAAKSPQNVQFFGSANSLLDQGGTLDQLSNQHAQLGNTKIPLFNKWKDYLNYQAGDSALAGFMQTAIGVADDYAKVMGGGQGSDTSRLQVLQSFANAHNPAQMQNAIGAARDAVRSQVKARIGNNKVMRQMYGYNLSSQNVQTPNQNAFQAFSSDGKWGWNGKQWVSTGK